VSTLPDHVIEKTTKTPPYEYHLARCSDAPTFGSRRGGSFDHGLAWLGSCSLSDIRCPVHGAGHLRQTTRNLRATWWVLDRDWTNELNRTARKVRRDAKALKVAAGFHVYARDLKVGMEIWEGSIVKLQQPVRGRKIVYTVLLRVPPRQPWTTTGNGGGSWGGASPDGVRLSTAWGRNPDDVVCIDTPEDRPVWDHAAIDAICDDWLAFEEQLDSERPPENRSLDRTHWSGGTYRDHYERTRQRLHAKLDELLIESIADEVGL